MGEKLKPEEQLRRVRAKARTLFEQLEANEAVKRSAEAPKSEDLDHPLGPDQLNLFLRSLHSQLKHAIAEVQASSKDLAELAAEVRQVEARLERGN